MRSDLLYMPVKYNEDGTVVADTTLTIVWRRRLRSELLPICFQKRCVNTDAPFLADAGIDTAAELI